MASTVHVGDTRALIFPVMCDGHLKIEYDDYNSNNLTGTNTIDTARHPLWSENGPFTVEALITPYDVNGVGDNTTGQGRLDSTKTPPSPNLNLDDHANTTSNYQSVSYFGAGRNSHKMMIFCNDYLKFYLQNTTSSNFNQPAEYKLVVEITDSVGVPISHTLASEPIFISKKTLYGYYDANGLYETQTSGVLSTSKTAISTSATAQLPSGSLQITGNLASFANVASTSATLGTATISMNTMPTTSNGSLDASTTSATTATGAITFSSGWNPTAITASTTASNNNAIILRNRQTGSGTTANKTFRFFYIDNSASNGFPSDMQGASAKPSNMAGINGMPQGSLTIDTLLNAGYSDNDVFVPETGVSPNGSNQHFREMLTAAINLQNGGGSNPSSGLDITATTPTTTGVTGSISLIQDASGSAGNHSTTPNTGPVIGSTIASSGKLSATVFSGGANAITGTNINEYLTISMRNSGGSSLITKNFKFIPTANGNTNSVGTTANGTSVVRVVIGGNTSATANALRNAINHSNGFNSTVATVSGTTITLTSPSTGSQSGQTLSRTNEYTSDNIVSFGSNPFANYVAGTPATTTNAHIVVTDSSGLTKNYKPATTEPNNSTGTDNGVAVVYFSNDTSSTANTADNLRGVIGGSNGHNGSLVVSRNGSTVTVRASAMSGSHVMSNNNISSGLTLSNFSTGNSTTISVGSGEASTLGAGNSVYNNVGILIGTVASITGDNIVLTSAPTSAITSTIYTDQLKEALYLEQMSKVGFSFDGNTLTLYLNNQPVKRAKINIGKFQLNTGDCYIGQDGSLSASARKATQFMGELYEIALHKSSSPCATINTLTPNYNDTLFYYSFGD